jgi:hypothetical protein
MALTQYLTDTQLLLNDPNNLFFSSTALTNYVNKARNRIAEVSQCLPLLIPGSGSLLTIAVATGGSGYATAPTVTVSAPDAQGTTVQATAVATISGGAVTAITITNISTNRGYVATPTVTLTGGGYSVPATVGAITTTPYVTTIVGQEAYLLSQPPISTAVLNQQGYARAIGIQSISVSWGSMKPTLDFVPFTTFQARYRAYNIGQQNYPSVWTRLGRGAQQAIALWPIPGQVSQMEIVAYCQPIPLVDDTTYEAIPEPFTDCVKYYAAYLAHLNAQRKDDAMFMQQLYRDTLIENGVSDTPSNAPSAYDGD